MEECTNFDKETKALYQSIMKGYINIKLSPELKKYQRVFPSVSIVDGIILKGHKIVVPSMLQNRILEAAHDGH